MRGARLSKFQEALCGVVPPRYRRARLCHVAPAVRDRLLAAVERDGAILFGPPGVGKTYVLCALARWLMFRPGKRLHVARVRWDDLLSEIRSTFDGADGQNERDIVARCVRTNVLILEDVGIGRGSDSIESTFTTKIFTAIIDGRLEACRPTFISTNKRPADFSKAFDARVASRLKMLDWIGIGGSDQRKPTARSGR